MPSSNIGKPHSQLNPSVSVIIPCFNNEAYVAEAIDSALGQTYSNIEVIVIDDGSTDASLNIIRSYGDRITWRTGPNRGQCAARNRGLDLSLGEFIHFLDADDYIQPTTIQSMVRAAVDKSANITFSPFSISYINGLREFHRPCDRLGSDFPPTILEGWLSGRYMPSHSVLWHAEFLRSVGGWDEAVIINDDGELMYRALMKSPIIAFAKEGCSVQMHRTRVNRVSRRRDVPSMRCMLDVYKQLRSQMRGTPFEVAEPALAAAFYKLAVSAFRNRLPPSLGRECLREARRLGLRGHPGNQLHAFACQIIGLQWKVRITTSLRQWTWRNPLFSRIPTSALLLLKKWRSV